MSTGRNDPCPCGSGLRYKKCCGKLEGDAPAQAALAAPATKAIPAELESPATLLARGIAHHQAGRLLQAEALYRQILTDDPNHVDALHLAGLIAQQTGDSDTAITMISQAARLRPDAAAIQNNLGNIFQERGDYAAARVCYEKALALQPSFAPAPFNIGNCLMKLEKFEAAIQSYERALTIQPAFFQAACGIGNALLELRQPATAEMRFRQILQAHPECAEAYTGLGQALQEQHQFDAACEQYRKALDHHPGDLAAAIHLSECLLQLGRTEDSLAACHEAVKMDMASPEAHYSLGNALFEANQLELSATSYQEAIRLRPDYAEAHYNLGNVYKGQDRYQDAMQCYERAIECRPDFIAARWAACMAQIPVLYDTPEEIELTRLRYRTALEQLDAALDLSTPTAIDAAVRAAASMQPFYLAYQGQTDRDLQLIFGRLMSRIMSAKYPQWATPILPAETAGRRLRIGFVSAFFFNHSNWKLPVRGWVEQLDPERFELYGYYTGKQALKDEQTAAARRRFAQFIEAPASIEQMAAAIRSDEIDVLIYPEIGMSPQTACLAALRLAPVQCNSWGHPQTSGLPTMDYFLSSDLMEPAGAQGHYSEQLVRLANLSVFHESSTPSALAKTRRDFGLAEDRTVFFCAQSLFKYLPQYDAVFPAIAEKVGKCQFAFIDNPQSPELTQRFVERIGKAFRRNGLSAEDYVVMLPHLRGSDYAAVNQLADVFLDSLGWNGCNSTIEAINCDLPIVSLPGSLMRGLHSQAILRMIGMEDTIAPDLPSYIALATRLGNDTALRQDYRKRIAANKALLARDKTAITSLEKFLEEAATRH